NSSTNVDLSNRTKDIQKISQALDVEPVALSEKVSQLKKEVDENRYNVDANKVADKILGSLLDEII
ncbi:MAG: flagellar biosynthesis anti-sigma factor FlgM, partial [Desulfobacteraceae bacterium]|nr:flagellar biosynthesis anti-sigma factor FlgM [Desulfobacteraceae bacterium]